MVNQQIPPNGYNGLPHQSHKSQVVAIVMSVLFVLTLGFAIWAFAGMLENQSNLDAKIETATEVAVQEAETAKEAEFTEREKSPFKTYKGSATYGSLTFDYPKSWSVFIETSDTNTILDFYAHPEFIPGFDDTRFAFRAQIIDSPYEDELADYDRAAERGEVKVRAFRPEKVPEQLGAIIEGEIDRDIQGRVVLLPQRDKTIRLVTETEDYLNDYTKIVNSMTYIP